jgi:hypothetical protein
VRNFHRSYFVDPELVPRSEYTTPDGLLKFRFTVTESTNFMGWNVPVKFDWVHYDVGRNGQWGPHYAGTGTVTSIRQAGKPEGLLVAGMEQTVVDWRMRHEAKQILSIIYVSTNAFVAPTDDPTLQERLARKAARKWAETTITLRCWLRLDVVGYMKLAQHCLRAAQRRTSAETTNSYGYRMYFDQRMPRPSQKR